MDEIYVCSVGQKAITFVDMQLMKIYGNPPTHLKDIHKMCVCWWGGV